MKKIKYLTALLLTAIVCTACSKGSSTHAKISAGGEADYESLIEKYVGKKGEEYWAHKELAHGGNGASLDMVYTADEWLNEDGGVTIPFDTDAVRNKDVRVYAGYYVPDEIAVTASTKDLVNVAMDYFYGMESDLLSSSSKDWLMEHVLRYSNALEESLRRDDFAVEYYDWYMKTDFIKPGDESDNAFFTLSRSTLLELILAQTESCAQLTEEQRVNLIKRLIEKARLIKQGEVIRESYIWGSGRTPVFFEFIERGNMWFDEINKMKLSDEEWKIIDSYIKWN